MITPSNETFIVRLSFWSLLIVWAGGWCLREPGLEALEVCQNEQRLRKVKRDQTERCVRQKEKI